MDSLFEFITASMFGGDLLGTNGLSIIWASGEQNVVNLGLGLRLIVVLILVGLLFEVKTVEWCWWIVPSVELLDVAAVGPGDLNSLCNLQW